MTPEIQLVTPWWGPDPQIGSPWFKSCIMQKWQIFSGSTFSNLWIYCFFEFYIIVSVLYIIVFLLYINVYLFYIILSVFYIILSLFYTIVSMLFIVVSVFYVFVNFHLLDCGKL